MKPIWRSTWRQDQSEAGRAFLRRSHRGTTRKKEIEMSRQHAVNLALFALAFVAVAIPAGARTKSGYIRSTLTNPADTAGAFTNTSSNGSFSYSGTKFSLKAKATTVADTDGVHCTGDDIICLVNLHFVANPPAAGDLVVAIRGEAAKGKITASHDLCKDRDAGIDGSTYGFCPEAFAAYTPVSVSIAGATCYAADAAWSAAHMPTSPMSKTGHSCEGLFPSDVALPASVVLFTTGSNLVVK
jgi:hypothetical protein